MFAVNSLYAYMSPVSDNRFSERDMNIARHLRHLHIAIDLDGRILNLTIFTRKRSYY